MLQGDTRNRKTCVLFSGGFDSALAAIRERCRRPDLVFVNYDQLYVEHERRCAAQFAQDVNLPFIEITMTGWTDMPDRNLYLMDAVRERGYDTIVMGVRMPFKCLDRYGDSNASTLRKHAKHKGVEVVLPLLWWSKKKVFETLSGLRLMGLYNCYYNLEDASLCPCANCAERRKLGYA